MFRNTGKGTTAWLTTTLASSASMIGATIYAANTAGSACNSAVNAIKTFAASTISTPFIKTDVTLEIPEYARYLLGSKMTVPIEIPAHPLKVSELIGSSATSFLNEIPGYVEQICRDEVALHGTAYALIVVGLAALTTYAYAKNHQLTIEMAKKVDLVDENSEDQRLMKHGNSV